jgi:hypothetical protein
MRARTHARTHTRTHSHTRTQTPGANPPGRYNDEVEAGKKKIQKSHDMVALYHRYNRALTFQNFF